MSRSSSARDRWQQQEDQSGSHLKQRLSRQGINPHGSPASIAHESRLERALTRSYRQSTEHLQSPTLGVCSKEGPIAEETERLMLSHYDEREELFYNFLDTSYMAYSMAYYGETAQEVLNSALTLEQAQEAKFEAFCQRSQLQGTERVFNIGCGFGSLETFLLQKYPRIQISGLTPSKVQLRYLRNRMADRRDVLSCGRFTLFEGNFDSVPLSSIGLGTYDVVFSVGVLEHIKNLKAAFEKIAALLVPEGRAFHHLIASHYFIPRFMDTKKTRIDEYFPGGRVWSFAELATHTEYFDLEQSWYLNGMNYWKTLDEWHARFWDNISSVAKVLDEESIRHWNDYFSLCKIVFSPFEGRTVGNGQYLFRKKSQQ